MMHFVVHALDKPDALPRRLEVIDAHRRYLEEAPALFDIKILLSGPLTDDAGEVMCGSFFLLEAPDRDCVEAFFASDPLALADIWQDRSITAVHVRQNNM